MNQHKDAPILDFRDLNHFAVEQGPYRRFLYKASTGSTNADLLAAVSTDIAPVPDWTIELADYQEAGRGRQGRVWTAPRGSQATMSVLISLTEKEMAADLVRHASLLPLAAGLAVYDVIGALDLGIDATLKWPNDVLVGDKKLCGILCEAISHNGQTHIVIGLGLNTLLKVDELPVPTATSLYIAAGQAGVEVKLSTHEEAIKMLMLALHRRISQWRGSDEDRATLRVQYMDACGTIGSEIRIELPTRSSLDGEAVIGRCIGLDGEGHIEVETKGGIQTFSAGDVHHLRQS
ncbi:MAG: biotin--[acetyl-CoA-carboxylase] ligase [Corynebacterium sp.]|nr:biotin--[acetyl-CoA-carboxylase] ligase [Corynebacterium sp.]